MAKFKPTNHGQGHLLPVFFSKQLQKGTFEYAMSYLLDYELELSHIEQRYKNDDGRAPAYDPRIRSISC